MDTIIKPTLCRGCVLEQEGEGFLASPSFGSNGVLLLGEALGEEEAKEGRAFVGRAGFMLTRLLEWAGLDRSQFGIFNTVWCRPPGNRLEGTSFESPAIRHCREHYWDHLLSDYRVVVPMGNVPLNALTGRKGILTTRGYIRPGPAQTHLVPTVHPSFIVRGQSRYAAAFINDVRKAVRIAEEGFQGQVVDYLLDPLPHVALEWAQAYRAELARNPTTLLAYDIETPYASQDESERGDDDSWNILRISFSYKPFAAMSVPFTGPYMAAIRLLLDADGVAIDWNGESFDRPRLRKVGFELNRPCRDGMIAWHVLHSDLPKSLGFVATFTCPLQPEWKHLSSTRPAFYAATDADVTLRTYLVIEEELRKIPGLWEAYERDVIQLEAPLTHMSQMGMPIDAEVRLDRAVKLRDLMQEVMDAIDLCIPDELRRYEPAAGFVRDPINTEGLVQITLNLPVKRCSRCGEANPKKPHFRVLKKKVNPCAGAEVVEREEPVQRWARPVRWTPSSRNLIQYQVFHDRVVPHKYDKQTQTQKPSMDKKGIKNCRKRYPDDPLYELCLRYRELDKLKGTYIGEVEEDGG